MLTMPHWHLLFLHAFTGVERLIIIYVAAINTIYLLLMTLGYFAFRMQPGRLTRTESDTVLRSPLMPPISLLAPAYNERASIRESVRAMLTLHYPRHEVIVVNDGSTDDTLQILIDEFHLYKSSREPSDALACAPIRAIYESRSPIRLVVIDKENGHGKADALNAALNVARTPLVAVLDADSLIETDALLAIVKPFLDDPHTIATGGIIRVANGCKVEHGRVVDVATPAQALPRFQVVEYLRAFLHGRIAFSFINSVLLVSGAFGVFRRDALISAGGYDTTTVGEDMELVIRLHHVWRERRLPYRIVFVPYPVCWTQVPESWRALHDQRNRWQRGTIETVWAHKAMIGNPRYGFLGLFAFPYFVLFEMLGPLVEYLGSGLWYTRASSVAALGRMGNPRAAAPLVGMLNDPNRTVRDAVWDALVLLCRNELATPELAQAFDALPEKARRFALDGLMERDSEAAGLVLRHMEDAAPSDTSAPDQAAGADLAWKGVVGGEGEAKQAAR